MEMAVIAIVALLAGAGLGWFLGSRPVAEWKARHGERDAEARQTEEKFRKAIVDLENATVRAGRADALDAEIPLGGVDVYARLDSIGWAQESHDIVRSREFAYYWARADQTIEPGEAYYQRSLRTSRDRLKQAGVRLAGLLNQLAGEREVAAGGGGASTVSGALD